MSDRIFVVIAAYRDPECQWTLRDLFARAARPERIFAGVCWQLVPEQDAHCFLIEPRPEQVRRQLSDARTTRGLCWARSVAHDLWRGEEYVLQIDSHMRFHDGWDETLLAVLSECPSARPVLSTYPAAYVPPRLLEDCGTPRILLDAPGEDGLPRIRSETLDLDSPRPSVMMAGGFQFARAELYREVPYDPAIGFYAEEILFSARVFTHGWDAFVPHRCALHHYYERQGIARYSDDAPHAAQMEDVSLVRIQHVLGVAAARDPSAVSDTAPGERYGLGTRRALAEFEERAGVHWRREAAAADSRDPSAAPTSPAWTTPK